jgi:hypothetical protein
MIDYEKLERLELKAAETEARKKHLKKKLDHVALQAEVARHAASKIVLTGVSRSALRDYKYRLHHDLTNLHRDLSVDSPESSVTSLVSDVVTLLKQKANLEALYAGAVIDEANAAGLLARVRQAIGSIGG